MKSQIATLNISENKRGMHIKKMPYAFTEQGIYMLATVIKGELAEQQSIFIMRAFKEMRHFKLSTTTRLNEAYESAKENNIVFKSKITKISVEMIGENEESIIVIEKELI